LADVADLLREAPEQAKSEFYRLGIRFTISPVQEGRRVFLRAEGSGDFERLAFSQHAALSTVGVLDQRAIGSSKFVVDLAANRLGAGLEAESWLNGCPTPGKSKAACCRGARAGRPSEFLSRPR
jgi:hypothetical protein